MSHKRNSDRMGMGAEYRNNDRLQSTIPGNRPTTPPASNRTDHRIRHDRNSHRDPATAREPLQGPGQSRSKRSKGQTLFEIEEIEGRSKGQTLFEIEEIEGTDAFRRSRSKGQTLSGDRRRDRRDRHFPELEGTDTFRGRSKGQTLSGARRDRRFSRFWRRDRLICTEFHGQLN